ncbi:MAG: type IX secretion system membrane protein PorP/SprF, partial [Bacteroidota bacterium]
MGVLSHTGKAGLTILGWVIALTLSAQDMHFSQFNNSPMNLNPGLAGDFDGEYRFVLNQRRQWSSVTSNPFQTFGVSADAREPLDIENVGAGVSVYHDVAGDSRFNT